MAPRIKRSGDNVTFEFPFSAATPAAVFRRGDTLWLVFGSDDVIANGPAHSLICLIDSSESPLRLSEGVRYL